MPFAVGGGIRTIDDIKRIINAGAEKVIINSYAVEDHDFITRASDMFGSSTIVVSIDVKKRFMREKQVYTMGGKRSTGLNPVEFAKLMQFKGAGEILINSIDNDGLMLGYDLELIEEVSRAVSLPVVAVGGAGNLNDFKLAVNSYASAVAAGSMFVYHGARRGILINYLNEEQKKSIKYE